MHNCKLWRKIATTVNYGRKIASVKLLTNIRTENTLTYLIQMHHDTRNNDTQKNVILQYVTQQNDSQQDVTQQNDSQQNVTLQNDTQQNVTQQNDTQ